MAGRSSRRGAAVLVAALTGLLVLAPGAAAINDPSPPPASPSPGGDPEAGTAARCALATGEAPVRVEVMTLTPRAPVSADEPFQVTGRLVNCGREQVDDVELRLGVGLRIGTRSGLAFADEEPVVGTTRLIVEPARTALAPGGSTPFDIRLTVSQLRLGERNGVFPLTLQARARVDGERTRGPVGLASTFVPWLPDGPIAPTRIAWMLPLVDRPHQAPNEALLDDGLERLLTPDGRLQQVLLTGRAGQRGACDEVAEPLVEPDPPEPEPETETETLQPEPPVEAPEPCRGEPVPITYAVDPDLIGTVETMTRPYPVRRGDTSVLMPASANAERWLIELRAEIDAGAAVLALPYGDPDVVAMSRPGSPVRDEIEALRRLGQSEARRLLPVQPESDITWLPPGPLGSSVDILAGGEVQTLLLDPSALAAGDPTSGRTPNARTTLSSTTDPVNALVVDEMLSRLAEPDPTSPLWQGPRLAEQRWIAEAAAVTAERPSTSRTLLVAPRRAAELIPQVAGEIVSDTGRLPWLCPVPLAAAAAGTERCAGLPDEQGPAEAEERGTPVSRDRDADELSQDYLAELGEIRDAADQFTDQVLVPGTDATTDTKARLLRARGRTASQAWRDTRGGPLLLRLLSEEVTGLRSLVRLISEPVLLTGSSGTIRLVVQNELEQPVNIGVGLPRNPAARLESNDTALRVIPGRQAVQVSIQVAVRTSGRFTVRATLVDASGRPFGDVVELPVRSTQYGRVALAVTGLAAGVLLVTVGVRITRRALRRPA